MNEGEFTLTLVGEGEQRAALERMVSELGLARRVHFAGWVGRDLIPGYYRRADIFVTATTWEGMPNTVLEAMACGLPVIGTQVSGLHELVRDGVNGYLVPVKDARALAEAISRLMGNGYERRRMGRQSRKLVEREFAWQFIAEQYVTIYRQVLRETQDAGSSDK